MIGEPPSAVGDVHVMIAEFDPVTMFSDVGAFAPPRGVTATPVDGTPAPIAVNGTTRTMYVWPLTSEFRTAFVDVEPVLFTSEVHVDPFDDCSMR